MTVKSQIYTNADPFSDDESQHNNAVDVIADRLLGKRPSLRTLKDAVTLGGYVDPVLAWGQKPDLFPYADLLLDLIGQEVSACYGNAVALSVQAQLRKSFSVETGMHVSLPRTLDRASVSLPPSGNINTLVFQSILFSTAAHAKAGHKFHISCSTGRVFLTCAASSAAYFQSDVNNLIRLHSNKWSKTPQCFLPPLALDAFDKSLLKTPRNPEIEKRVEIMRASIARHPDRFSRQIVTAHAGLYDAVVDAPIRQIAIDYELFAPEFLARILEDKSSAIHQLFSDAEGLSFLLNEFADVDTAWRAGEAPFDAVIVKDGMTRLVPYEGDLSPQTLVSGLRSRQLMPKTALNFMAFLLEAGIAPMGGMQQTLYATQIRERMGRWLAKHRPHDVRGEAFRNLPTDRAALTPVWGVRANDMGTPISYEDALNGWRATPGVLGRIASVSGEAALKAGAVLVNNFVCPENHLTAAEQSSLLRTLAQNGALLHVE